ncbi:hypothetical protein TeGR_g3305 [Tetraparma gracilis]|uniref:Uncharacterized protein n=1 Tax=Tetraparma gracilis TaxID=2962635 RepID=A0ABQ6N8P2_9STRA|nr:hypothetical protein TeGR_g3305 [Tetraparma gracilis]
MASLASLLLLLLSLTLLPHYALPFGLAPTSRCLPSLRRSCDSAAHRASSQLRSSPADADADNTPADPSSLSQDTLSLLRSIEAPSPDSPAAAPDELDAIISSLGEVGGGQPSANLTKALRSLVDDSFLDGDRELESTAAELRALFSEEILAKTQRPEVARMLEEDRRRLERGEAQVNSLLGKVEREKEAVSDAVRDLERLSEEASRMTSQDPAARLLGFRDAPIVKKAALVAALLFPLRAVSELAGLALAGGAGGGGGAFVAVLVQFGIGIAAGFYFFLP